MHLRSDIKANIGEPFFQARRALRYIEETESPEFREPSTGRILQLKKDAIRRKYLVTVSQHHLAGLDALLRELHPSGKDEQYPFCTCIADLEIVVEFCKGPEVLLHYIQKMLDVRTDFKEIHADALGYFGAYLDTRLQEERFLVKGGKRPDCIALFDFGNQFDEWMHFKRGEVEAPPEIGLKIPDEIQQILRELREQGHQDGAKWIAFGLLDLSDRMLEAIAKAFRELRSSTPSPGMFRRVTFQEAGTVISILGTLDLPVERLQKRTVKRALIEKYRRKAERTIGLGTMILNTRLVECLFWGEKPWEHDEKMELDLANDASFRPALGERLPGRNAPCICGSGIKYKKCCLPKLQQLQETDETP